MPRTVMIVDDSMIMTQKLTVMLRDLGHQVVRVCKSGAEAVRDYPLVKPDIVTMDITMPGMDGIEAMAAIMATDRLSTIVNQIKALSTPTRLNWAAASAVGTATTTVQK